MALARIGIRRRAARARDRQLAYQRRKAERVRGREDEIMGRMRARAGEIRRRLEAFGPIPEEARLLEVGCGPGGHTFFFGLDHAIGVDPLAAEYAKLFPLWYSAERTAAAGGETLPFADSSFDIVLCDNVVDHAEDPRAIVEEMARVLVPGGLLYFVVNVHHPFYHLASTLHAAWNALGLRVEITPFADHTVHLTPAAARALFDGLPFERLSEADDVGRPSKPRQSGGAVADLVRRLFFKNARYELIASRSGQEMPGRARS